MNSYLAWRGGLPGLGGGGMLKLRFEWYIICRFSNDAMLMQIKIPLKKGDPRPRPRPRSRSRSRPRDSVLMTPQRHPRTGHHNKEEHKPASCLLELNCFIITGNRTPKLMRSPMFASWHNVAHAHTKYDQPLSCCRRERFGLLSCFKQDNIVNPRENNRTTVS